MQVLIPFKHLLPNEPDFDYSIILDNCGPEIDGTYELLDLYCEKPFCGCHKVSIVVLDSRQNTVATISYGWKSKSFYHKGGLDRQATEWLTQGFLDPYGVQSKHSPIFLQIFLNEITQPQLLSRIKERYAVFKEAILAGVRPPTEKPKPLPDNVTPIRRRST